MPFRNCAEGTGSYVYMTKHDGLRAGRQLRMIFRSRQAPSGSVDPCTRMLSLVPCIHWYLAASALTVGRRRSKRQNSLVLGDDAEQQVSLLIVLVADGTAKKKGDHEVDSCDVVTSSCCRDTHLASHFSQIAMLIAWQHEHALSESRCNGMRVISTCNDGARTPQAPPGSAAPSESLTLPLNYRRDRVALLCVCARWSVRVCLPPMRRRR